MQEELEQKSVAISIKAGKLTANLLKKALEKALAEMAKSQKSPKIYKGKQSVKHLVRQSVNIRNLRWRPEMYALSDFLIMDFVMVSEAVT